MTLVSLAVVSGIVGGAITRAVDDDDKGAVEVPESLQTATSPAAGDGGSQSEPDEPLSKAAAEVLPGVVSITETGMAATSVGMSLDERARSLLEANTQTGELDGRLYRFSVPSLRAYPFQWFWDSCFHAIVWSRSDAERAADELRGLLAVQEPDGLIPHVIFWKGDLVSRRSVGKRAVSRQASPLRGWQAQAGLASR